MTQTEIQSIVSLSLLAAFADGSKHDRERAEIKRIADALAASEAVHLPTLVQDVLMKRVDLAGTAAALRSADTRQLAYEMAVCVCDADGVQSLPEQKFLEQLRSTLGLDAGRAVIALEFSRKRIAQDVRKTLQSAIANAENNHSLDVDRLFVAEAYVGKNLTMKRGRPRARGRFGKIMKPFSELTIKVRQVEAAGESA